MSIPVYTFGIPRTGQSLGVTKVAIQSNLDSLAMTQNVDHINMNDSSGNQGMHKFVRFPSQITPPSSGTNEWDIFNSLLSAGASLTQEIFLQKPNNGGTYALTASAIGPINGATGVSWLAGGIYIQWSNPALDSTSPTPQPIQDNSPFLFSSPFPNQCFGVILQGVKTGNTPVSLWVKDTTLTRTGFSIRTNSTVGEFNRIYYIAIGN